VRLLVIGAGGHAKVVVDAARTAGIEVVGIVARDPHPATLLGIPVHSDAEGIEADTFIVAVGDNATRAREFGDAIERGLLPASVIHPAAVLSESVEVGAGSFIAAGVIVNADAVIGENAILNTGCTVDHDCVIGDHAHVAPGVNICGGCTIGDGALLGVGSCVAPGGAVGEWSTIGAGAAVLGVTDARTVCVGVPARVIRREEA